MRLDPNINPIHHAMSIPVKAKELKVIKIHPALYEAMASHWRVKRGDTIRELAESAIAFYIEPTGDGT